MRQQSLFDWTPDGRRRAAVKCRALSPEQPCTRCARLFRAIRKSQLYCEDCAKVVKAEAARRSYWKHAEKRRAESRSERQRNREKWRDYQRAYNAANRDKLTQSARAHREKNRDRYFDRRLRRDYGITLDEYNRILQEQGGGCGICGVVEARSKSGNGRLHVDHDHETGKTRGLLCDTCNRGIGQLGDDPERVKAAVRYLERTTNNGRVTADGSLDLVQSMNETELHAFRTNGVH